MFGEMLGLWCAQVWHDQGKPEAPQLVELGPGRGTLMADALRAAEAWCRNSCDGLEVVLVEASPALREMQAETLQGLRRADSLDARSFDDALTDRPLFLLANEFFDALPIRQYVKTERGWCERMVVLEGRRAGFRAGAAVAARRRAFPPDRAGAPDGGVYEVSPAATRSGRRNRARRSPRQGGAALIARLWL